MKIRFYEITNKYMDKENIIKEFKEKFYPFIAYRSGGKATDFTANGGIEVVEQLEHCEQEIIDWIAEKIGTRNLLFKDTNVAYLRGRKDCEQRKANKLN